MLISIFRNGLARISFKGMIHILDSLEVADKIIEAHFRPAETIIFRQASASFSSYPPSKLIAAISGFSNERGVLTLSKRRLYRLYSMGHRSPLQRTLLRYNTTP